MEALRQEVQRDSTRVLESRIQTKTLPYTSCVRLGSLPDGVTCTTVVDEFCVPVIINEREGIVSVADDRMCSEISCFCSSFDVFDPEEAVTLRHLCVASLLSPLYSAEKWEYASTTCYEYQATEWAEEYDISVEEGARIRVVYFRGSQTMHTYALGEGRTVPLPRD
jgi:hypothetical protein